LCSELCSFCVSAKCLDLKLELGWLKEAGSQAGVPATVAVRRKRREWLGWAAALLLLLVGGVGYYLAYLEHSRVLSIAVRSSIEAPEKETFSFTGDGGGPPAVSPDGTQVVYAALDSQGKQHLWLRALNSLTTQLIAGTDNATFPFWSPDSHKIGFFADGNLKVVDLFGAPALVNCRQTGGHPETAFAETSARSAFDRTTLPPSRLAARDNFRVARDAGAQSEGPANRLQGRSLLQGADYPSKRVDTDDGDRQGRPFFRRQRLSLFARRLCRSALLSTLLQLGLRQVHVSHRLRDHHSATRDFVIM